MKNFSIKSALALPVTASFIMIALLGSPGCSDNPVEQDHDHEEHAEPVGLVVFDSDTEIVRVEQGTVTGSFELTVDQLSPHYTLRFLDEDGDEFVPDDPDFSPGEVISTPEHLEIVRDEPGDWNFHLLGTVEGSETIQLTIKHGGHNDFISTPIPVVITK